MDACCWAAIPPQAVKPLDKIMSWIDLPLSCCTEAFEVSLPGRPTASAPALQWACIKSHVGVMQYADVQKEDEGYGNDDHEQE